MVNIVIIYQARVGSSSLPSKILKKINKIHYWKYSPFKIKKIKVWSNGVVVATTFEKVH